MGFLAGKRALILGVLTDRSIAWGIARAMHREGAQLAFTYANEKLKERVEPLARSLSASLVMPAPSAGPIASRGRGLKPSVIRRGRSARRSARSNARMRSR